MPPSKRPPLSVVARDLQDLTVKEIAEKHNVSPNTVPNWAKYYGLEWKRQKKYENLTKQVFGEWTVLRRSKVSRTGAVLWDVRCSCGKQKRMTSGHLRAGQSISCGHGRWTGYKGVSGKYWKSVIQKARLRGISVDIDCAYAWRLYQRQKGKCALTGWDIILNKTASLDRVNSRRGYVKGNLQWVHKNVNWMKNRFSQERFIEVCEAVTKHHLSCVDHTLAM